MPRGGIFDKLVFSVLSVGGWPIPIDCCTSLYEDGMYEVRCLCCPSDCAISGIRALLSFWNSSEGSGWLNFFAGSSCVFADVICEPVSLLKRRGRES